MAALGAQTVCSTKLILEGVGPLLGARKRSLHHVPSMLGNRLHNRELKKRTSLAKLSRRAIVCQKYDDRSNSRELESISDYAHRKDDAETFPLDAVDSSRVVSESTQSASFNSKSSRVPPRYATLRSFGEAGGAGVVTGEFECTSVFELIAANIEATKQVKNWEVLSGRLAMLALSTALGVEIFTGNSVFNGIDAQKLEAVGALCAIAFLSAGGFAFAWRAKADVVTLMSKGYKNMVESALDNLIEGLFFDES